MIRNYNSFNLFLKPLCCTFKINGKYLTFTFSQQIVIQCTLHHIDTDIISQI